MGSIASLVYSTTFCLERVLTWTCCAFLLMILMFSICLLVVYGISVGYHYAQKELASFALWSRISTTPRYPVTSVPPLRTGLMQDESRRLQQLVTNTSLNEVPVPEQFKKLEKRSAVDVFDKPGDDIITEKPTAPELTPRERQMVLKLLGRYRRSRVSSSTTAKISLRPLVVTTSIISAT